MEDITTKIYDAIINNEEIMKHVPKNNIKFFDYPNAQEIKDIVIVIDPLDTPKPDDFADNDNLTYEYLYQIDVRGPNYDVVKLLQEEIRQTLWSIGFKQVDGTDEYDTDLKLYMDARRYRGNPYTIDGLRHIDKHI